MNIAMWSGPRNLSTAMMYSFGARQDCAIWDEPFYAAYLAKTGLEHPMRAEIIAAGEVDPAKVARSCQMSHASGKPVFYQKHMTHHMIEDIPRDWFVDTKHVFLIRHPSRVLASYAKKREGPDLMDIGLKQQVDIFHEIKALGQPVTVVDSFDIRQDPEAMLRKLCAAIDLEYDPAMTQWPAGGHADDGVWAAHWYDVVHKSTGFAGAEGDLPELPAELKPVLEAAMPYYETMRAEALSL